jgi:glycerol kinase
MILAIDQGTTGTTCLVFALDGTLAGRAAREFPQHFPRPGWVEHDLDELWATTRRVAIEALDDAGVRAGGLTAIGLTNQRETACAWDRATGRPLHRALVWQDRRTAPRCAELREAGHEEAIRARTGLVLDPYFSATKYEWLLGPGEVDPAAPGLALGTIDAFVAFRLTGAHVTDRTNASRTLLLDLATGTWDDGLLDLFGVPARALPEVVPSIGEVGRLRDGVLPGHDGTPVCGIAGDQQAALYGQACLEPGEGKSTYGTGSFVLVHAGDEVPPPAAGLLATAAVEGYALEAAVLVSGAAVQWLRDGLGIIATADETEPLARSVASTGGVVFVPALTGLGSPHWDPYARGTVVGLTRGTTRAHLARATLEAMAFQTVDAVRAMEAAGGEPLRELRADGGATANGWLLQFQADVLGVPVVLPMVAETTALGAAFLAGVGAGAWTPRRVRELWRQRARFEPLMSADERAARHAEWSRAVERARGWAGY